MTSPRKKRVLVVHHPGTISSLVRAGQYHALFDASAEWEVEYINRTSPALQRWLRLTNRPWIPLVRRCLHEPLRRYSAWWHRRHDAAIVRHAAAFDVVYAVKTPHLEFYRGLVALQKPKIFADFNDGLWLPYFQECGWRDLDAILARVHGVICENDHVANYARRYNPRCFVVSDAPQLEMFDPVRATVKRDPERVVFGWIGSEENIGHLYSIMVPLERLFARYPHLHLRIVGARSSYIPHFEHVRWSCVPEFDQARMVREVLGFDVGLFPLFHLEDGRARGTLKAKVYMSGECVAACERFGENSKLIVDQLNGVLAETQDEWHAVLDRLVIQPEERRAIARRGLETIRANYSARQMFTGLVGAFDSVLAES